MKTKFILLAIMLSASAYIYAGPADPRPFKAVQPNGDTLTLIHRGDEYHSYFITIDGVVVEKDADGYWKHHTTQGSAFTLSSTKATLTHFKIL